MGLRAVVCERLMAARSSRLPMRHNRPGAASQLKGKRALNARAKLPAEASTVSPGCDDAPCAGFTVPAVANQLERGVRRPASLLGEPSVFRAVPSVILAFERLHGGYVLRKDQRYIANLRYVILIQ